MDLLDGILRRLKEGGPSEEETAGSGSGSGKPRGKRQRCPHCKGSGFFDFLDPNKNGLAAKLNDARAGIENGFNTAKAGVIDAGQKVSHELTDPDSVLRGQVVPIAGKVAGMLNKIPGVQAIPGVGELTTAIEYGSKANDAAKSLGFGKHPGKQGPKAASKRAALVKQIMKEKKLSMIAASQYIKTHGMYGKAAATNLKASPLQSVVTH